jgi:putative transposase
VRIHRSFGLRRFAWLAAESVRFARRRWVLGSRRVVFVAGLIRTMLMVSPGGPDHERAGGVGAPAQGGSGVATGAGDPKKSRGLLHPGKRDAVTVFRFIEAEKASYPIAMLCRLLGVSASGYHAWRCRAESPRRRADNAVCAWVARIHGESRQTYGAPRIHAELRADGVRVGKKRVARLMRELGLEGAYRRKYRRTTVADPGQPPAPDLVRRDFCATRPDQLWVADITYVRTWQGWLNVAIVVDTYSRRVVGWSLRDDLRAELVVDALEMAVCVASPRLAWYTTPIVARSTPAGRSVARCATPASSRAWAAAETPTTTPRPRASCRPSKRSSSTAAPGPPATTPGERSSTTSKAGTTPAAATQPSAT